MTLSIAEKSYLYDSLTASPSIRPDGRKPHQFRPIEVSTDFLPSSNGSSRIISGDGSECIVSVKAKVIDHTLSDEELIQVDLDIAGERTDSPQVETLMSLLNKVLKSGPGFEHSRLQLTERYSFKIFIDILVISSNCNPASLISFAMFSALNTTTLPKLISSFDDLKVEELPMFDDYDLVNLKLKSPLVFLLAIVGNNLIVDPDANESEVCDNAIIVTWLDGKIRSPIRTLTLNNSYSKGFDPTLLQKGLKLIEENAAAVLTALESS
ncbi:hypothetical protein TPHA_0G00970 [Tetrapisispora phaffii CBS 4417]|uniref:Ribosomal RNA-processing protein 42 n=1 Tax=Tetrapisispora phaffii (strain ATCC 24235 / CBS 4417 / NBRC 1672 / NRRL Y-8282 / UCD 70-5) TaxID=1071381 RepID=G8BVK5_TETPH|nr:hypothetical protein TPHA_0G00970 [Tetrapisispora phaffii CBS 4417]CCE63933.1 hypothetical protein TPHA_0G00970 [Tetrapisispora phaffii CBS 4417]